MNLLKWLFNPEWFIFRMDGGGGGGGAPATQTQISDVPDWAKPYAKEILGRASALTDINKNPYQQYGGERIAQFSPLQEQAFSNVGNMQVPGQTGEASNITQQAAYRALNSQYQPGNFQNQFQAPAQYRPEQFSYMGINAPELQQYQMGPAQQVRGGQYDAPQMANLQEMGAFERVNPAARYNTPEMRTARTDYNPDIEAFQMGPAQQVQGGQYATPEMKAAQTEYNPNLQQYQMGPAERASTQSFTQPGSAEDYMNPFMQSVVDKQTREAERQSALTGRQQRARAIQQGSFGGGRTAVTEAAQARDLAQLKSDIYGTGQQAAFQNAQQQFNTEQQARMQAQLANQQAGLTVGGQNLSAKLGIQQLGTQTGAQTALANLSSQQQANVQNQAAQLQTQGLSASQAMQAALANQQAGLTVGQQNLASRQGAQQLRTQTGTQTSLANLSAEQQANVQNQAAQLQTQGLSAQQAMQAALANQQAGLTTGQQNLSARLTRDQQNLAAQLQTQGLTANQAMQAALANQQAGLTTGQQNLAAQLGVQQLGSGQNMQAQLAEQQAYQNMLQQREASRQFGYGQQMTAAGQGAQYGQAAQQLGEQSRQYGAGYGLQGLQAATQGAGQLGNLGQQQFNQQRDIAGMQGQFGSQQQQQRQQLLNQQYQDFLNQERYPYQQTEYLSGLMRGTPLGTVNTMYQAPPSALSQVAGLGVAGAGAYGMMNRKKGGAIKDKAKTRAGLNELALMKMGA